ncbi:MAG: ComF family protein [Paraprevotella sp.]|nr:ComF family protein [Paraprevotella sp.]
MWTKKISDRLSLYSGILRETLFPRYCQCCRTRLSLREKWLCADCHLHLPRVDHTSFRYNKVCLLFWGVIPIQKGSAFFHYTKTSAYKTLLSKLKYHNRPDIGFFMGRMMAMELKKRGFFEGIDLIVPIPLSPQREHELGYNQSAWIARGIAEITGLEIDNRSVQRIRSNPSQTTLTPQQRQENVRNLFSVRHPGNLDGRHILLVDDVITTGATMKSCAEAISQVCHVRISILSLTLASHT